MKPRVGVLMGDPTGVGPELIATLLAKFPVRDHAEVLIIGDHRYFGIGETFAGVSVPVRVVGRLEDVDFGAEEFQLLNIRGAAPDEFTIGQLSAKAGASVLDVLGYSLDLAKDRKLDALVYGPFNKEAMAMAGSPFPDESHFIADRLGWTGHFSEINIVDELWTSRVTSHVAFSQVSSLITREAVYKAIMLVRDALQLAGVREPRLGVAALNPHGGEGGLFGKEEREAIAPAVSQARLAGINVSGPFPADTIFLRAKTGAFDAVVTMYHDQGQIALKLMGFDRIVAVEGGLPIPITSPSHGTAFEIAGRGKADPGATWQAFRIACRMGANARRN